MTTAVSLEKLRAWWAHRQGLDGSLDGASPHDVLARTGWARSVGGCGPYLGLFARAGLDREAVDKAVANLEVHELPSARGCTYVVPRQDFALGLAAGSGAPDGEIAAAAKHLGVTREEIDRLSDRIVAALDSAGEPLDPAGIKRAVGEAVRNLGEAGKKRGLTTTLPLALGLLQARGRIRRVPVNGRLDQQRFGYVPWSPSPLTDAEPDRGAAHAELARRYFGWAGPASLKHFRWFSGLTAAAAKQAVEPLDLRPIEGTELLLPPDQVAAFEKFTVPRAACYALVAWIDGIHLLHRDPGRLLDPGDAARQSPAAKPGRTLGDESDPPCSIIVDRGRVVGLWEYDPDTEEIVYQAFVTPTPALRKAVSATRNYVRDQLGDARMSSLDSPKSRAPRIAALRAGQPLVHCGPLPADRRVPDDSRAAE
ncbi:DNA glycosylase AlkZ-like family protein [Amycolatopsis anabasis]|uniref:DNA glycosylase AlkZ-like family protein n=1 Tax=Amycolatopsis anabasis TaxID=1840409 RepID=UPI00131B4B91|nr:crosslink repair DNA glycosylase YcaQ family protein [Amycolatopsis anabasis]